MNVAAAVLMGAALIAGSVVWASDRAGRDTRCAGFLASDFGAGALSRLSGSEIENGGKPTLSDAITRQGADAARLAMAGCRLDRQQ